MWNEEYKDEYIKYLEDKLSFIKAVIDLFSGKHNDYVVEEIINEFKKNPNYEYKTQHKDLAKEIFEITKKKDKKNK